MYDVKSIIYVEAYYGRSDVLDFMTMPYKKEDIGQSFSDNFLPESKEDQVRKWFLGSTLMASAIMMLFLPALAATLPVGSSVALALAAVALPFLGWGSGVGVCMIMRKFTMKKTLSMDVPKAHRQVCSSNLNANAHHLQGACQILAEDPSAQREEEVLLGR